MSETWVINEEPDISSEDVIKNILFTSNGNSYAAFYVVTGTQPSPLDIGITYDSIKVMAFTPAGYIWANEAYRTVTFETSPTGDLLTWLQANAVKQSTQPKTLKINSSVVHHVNGQYPLTFNTTSISGGYAPSYNISATCTNVTASASNPTTIPKFGSVTLTFTADGTNYKVPSSMPTITGATGSWNRVSDTECRITLSNPTGNVSFSVVGEYVLPQLSAPTGLSASGTTVTFTPSEDATSYKVYADGSYIGEASV